MTDRDRIAGDLSSQDIDLQKVEAVEPPPVDPVVLPADVQATPASTPAGQVRVADRAGRLRGRARARYLWEQTSTGVVSRWDILAVIAAGGVLGSLARWGLLLALPDTAAGFPSATFIANVSGCFLLGVLMVFVLDVWPPNRHLRPFLGVGVLGGYTTFSTYMLDARTLLVGGHAGTAGAYLLASLAAGLAAVWVAITAARLAVAAGRRHVQARHDRARPATAARPQAGG